MNDLLPLVTIRCITFNQELFIAKTLEGFVMQKTNFLFEAVVHDDASTDKTADIIRNFASKYPDIIKPIYETENQYSKHDGSLTNIINQHSRGKYLAICEGDDYWTDPLKLQKQVDFLENNPQYSLVYTNTDKLLNQKNKLICSNKIHPSGNIFDDLLQENFIVTCSTLFRKDLYIKCIENIRTYNRNWLMGDYPIWLELSLISKIKFLPDTTAVYRVLQESASNTNNYAKTLRFYNSVLDIQCFYSELNGKNLLIPQFTEFFNCKMYQLCIEKKFNEINIYRDFLKNTKGFSKKAKFYRLCSRHKIFELILKLFFTSVLLQKLYYKLK